jgi:serine/threonine-protein kinase
MALVYRARDCRLDTDVVIKVPRPEMLQDAEFRGRFTREIRSLVRLAHPHIVKIHDVGSHEDVPFAVLQFLAGGSLRQRQPRGADGKFLSLNPQHLRDWLPGVASALDFIHVQHFLHRDIKPDNILFDEHGHAYVSDFGIAKVYADDRSGPPQTVMTRLGVVVGTPQFMAPELLLARGCDGRVDQYALAVTVYYLLSGRYPFDGPTVPAIFEQQMRQTPPALSLLLPELPAALSDAVLRGLLKDPQQRHASCTAFAQAVLQALPNPYVTATAPADERAAPVAAADTTTVTPCPRCGQTFRLPAHLQGKSVQCPSCRTVFRTPPPLPVAGTTQPQAVATTPAPASPLVAGPQAAPVVPSAEAATTLNCPHCRMIVKLPVRLQGQTVQCPGCRQTFVAPPPLTGQGPLLIALPVQPPPLPVALPVRPHKRR